MKNMFTVLLAAIIFSINIFAQTFPVGSTVERNPKTNIDKLITGNVNYSNRYSGKVSPLLSYFMNRISENNGVKVQLPESYLGVNRVMFFYTDELDQLIIPLLIKTNSVESTKSTILSAGGTIGTIAGDIISAEIPVSSVYSLIESAETTYLEASTILELKIDISRTEIKVNQLHNGTGISRPYKGNGVVVGVLDSGIDWQHQDFKNTGGNRIQYLWDMSGSSNPPSGYNYGREYTKAQLDANQCQQIDGDDGGGHGTHVAGTAAGNGGANGSYIGMAPESDIVFVKGFRNGPGFASTDVVDGCNYIFQKAGQLGKPSVINLSLGGHFSPHDGTSLYEQALSNLTGNGKIIVAAAGNEGGRNIHLNYAVPNGSSYNDSYETFVELFNGANIFVSDMWYNGGNISVGLAAYSTSNLQLIGYTNGIAPGQKIEDVAFTISGTTYGYVTIDATGTNNPNNGGNEVLIVVDGHNGQVDITNVFWSVFTYGTGTFDAWAVTGGVFSTFVPENWFRPGDNLKTIGAPSTASKVICVGSYVTKNSWIDINGVTQFQPGNPTIGNISDFSSIGPTRDNRIKPDLTAPGEVIIAAYSSFLTQTPATDILLGGKHQKMQGTSMASPHVTGVVALMLEKNSSLNYDQTVVLLKNSARQDGFTGSTPNNTFGSGKLDAYTAFVNTSGGGGSQVTLMQEGFDQSFPPAGWTTQILNSSYTWQQGNPQSNNFNQIDPSSTNSAICPWVAQNQNEWLISPTLALGNGAASIEFYAAYSTQWLSAATLKLHISVNGGANWQEIWSAENDGQGFMWRQKTVDLSSYANQQNVKLGWQYIGNDGDLVGLDGIKLVGFPTSVEEIDSEIPEAFDLSFNYPNPFNPTTKFRYALPEARDVKIIIYDVIGTKVAELVNNFQNAGTYEVTWNGRNDLNQQVASGTYFFSVIAGDYIQTRKMLLIK